MFIPTFFLPSLVLLAVVWQNRLLVPVVSQSTTIVANSSPPTVDGGTTVEEASSDGTTQSADCYDVAADCQNRTADCNNTAYFGEMCAQCRKTCDLCTPLAEELCNSTDGGGPFTTETPPACVDVDPDCHMYVNFCTTPQYATTMCKNCRQTCQLCGLNYTNICTAPPNDPKCHDTVGYCTAYSSDCFNPNMRAYVCMNCRRFCNHCLPDKWCNGFNWFFQIGRVL